MSDLEQIKDCRQADLPKDTSPGGEADSRAEELVSMLKAVDDITEVWEGFGLMQKYDVDRNNCSSLQDIQDRLRLHFHKQLGQGRGAKAVSVSWSLLFNAKLCTLFSLDSKGR